VYGEILVGIPARHKMCIDQKGGGSRSVGDHQIQREGTSGRVGQRRPERGRISCWAFLGRGESLLFAGSLLERNIKNRGRGEPNILLGG